MSADFNLPSQEACWLDNSCIHMMVPGWLTLITLWLHFFSPFARWLLLRASISFPKSEHARRVFGNCLDICQEPDDSQQWTNAHNKGTWLDYQLATSTSGGRLGRREKAMFSLGKYQKGFIILIKASARHIRPTPKLFHGNVSLQMLQQEQTCYANIGLLCLSCRSTSVCVSERGETGWLVSVFNDVSAAGKFGSCR